MTAHRRLPPLVALALLAPALTSCQLLGGSSSLDEALEVVPGGATQVLFVDRAAMAERLEVDDIETGADEDEIGEYVEAITQDPVGGTALSQYVETMQDAVLSEFDVVWWAQASTEGEPPIDIYKVDDVDLDEFVGELEDAGFDSEETDGRTMLSGDFGEDGLVADAYPPEFAFGVLVDPDEDLVVTGGELDRVVEVLDDDADSLTDAGTFDDVADDVDDVEYAFLLEGPRCGVGPQTSEETIEQSGIGDLGSPTGLGYFVSGDGDDAVTSGRLRFDDDDAAEADLDARRDFLEDGQSLVTGEPVSDLGSAELEQDGALVQMELDLENPTSGRQMASQGDAFFACAP